MFAEFLSGRLRVINDELSQIKKETGKS